MTFHSYIESPVCGASKTMRLSQSLWLWQAGDPTRPVVLDTLPARITHAICNALIYRLERHQSQNNFRYELKDCATSHGNLQDGIGQSNTKERSIKQRTDEKK